MLGVECEAKRWRNAMAAFKMLTFGFSSGVPLLNARDGSVGTTLSDKDIAAL